MNINKLVKYVKGVGFKEFLKEFKENRKEVIYDPSFTLKMQLQGQAGVFLFSIISAIILFMNGIWYIAGIFVFNLFIFAGQFLATKKQLNNYNEIKNLKDEISYNRQEGERFNNFIEGELNK